MNIFGILCIVFMAINAGLIGLIFSSALKERSKCKVIYFVAQPVCGVLSLVFLMLCIIS